MGLDMFLRRRTYIGANEDFNNVTGTVSIKIKDKKIPIKLKDINYIEEEVGYWRKANQIHTWFVDNVQNGNDDCGVYDVSIESLKKLLELCKEVKEKAIIEEGFVQTGERLVGNEWLPVVEKGKTIKNPKEIAKILPTKRGFFFGSIDYDEYYLQDIDNTIKIIEKQIEREKELQDSGLFTYLQYHSSW